MKKCYFFGTFDPIHVGHIKIAQSVKTQFNFERVIFVPTPAPPHKNPDGASFFDRLKMLKLAVGEENVSDIETKIEPPNYTYKTVEKLAATGSQPIAFILGYDQFEKIETWKNPHYLREMLEFIVIPRNITGASCFAPTPHAAPDALFDFAHLAKKGYNFKVADFAPMDISSTQIREAVKNGKNISNLVDKKVENYIYEQRLYR